MNILVFLPFALLLLPFIPSALEFSRRKDKGPRQIAEQSTQEEKPDLKIPRLERARGKARIKATSEVMRITGSIGIPDGAEIGCSLVVQGSLELGRKCHVAGSLKAFGNIQVGESSVIEGHILSEGKITIGRNCVVEGVVDSPKDVVLEDGTVVEAVTTGSTVRFGLGARISKRVVSGASITTALRPPTMGEHPQAAPRPASDRAALAAPSPRSSLSTEAKTETVKRSDQVGQYLEDRARKLCEDMGEPREGTEPAGLNETEAMVFRLARTGKSLEEMGLRLLMDPSQIQEILSRLVKKGYLDEYVSSKRGKTGWDLQVRRLEKAEQPKHGQPKVFNATARREYPEPTEGRELLNAARKAAETLIASETRKREQEKRSILTEWENASSLLWKDEKNGEKHPASGPLSRESEELHESIKAAKELCKSPLRPHHLKSSIPTILLASSALMALLLAEIAYYSPRLVGFLNNILPLNLQTWVVFLILALSLGLASGVSASRHLNRCRSEASSD